MINIKFTQLMEFMIRKSYSEFNVKAINLCKTDLNRKNNNCNKYSYNVFAKASVLLSNEYLEMETETTVEIKLNRNLEIVKILVGDKEYNDRKEIRQLIMEMKLSNAK